MLKTLTTLNSLLGTLLALTVLGVLSFGGWKAYQAYFAEKIALQTAEETLAERDSQIEALSQSLDSVRQKAAILTEEVKQKTEEIERLNLSLRLLKVDHRVARIDVLAQEGSAENGDLKTQFNFCEVDDEGHAIETPRVFNIDGDVIYVDSWVIKFDDEFIEQNDPLRSKSIFLFRRIYGEMQAPVEGFALDAEGSGLAAYRGQDQMSELERELWSRFWEYANDAKKAQQAGVRAAHGEAPSVKLMPGRRYRLQIRASDGLSIVPEEKPIGDSPEVF